MKSLSLVAALLLGLMASTANASTILHFAGTFTGQNTSPEVQDFEVVLNLSASGDVISGTYRRPPSPADPVKQYTITGGTISGVSTVAFDLDLLEVGTNLVFSLSGAADLNGLGFDDWYAFFLGSPSGPASLANASGTIAMTSAVPEPGTWALMGGLVAGASAFGWRRRKAAKLAA
jgi:hypothetical protein